MAYYVPDYSVVHGNNMSNGQVSPGGQITAPITQSNNVAFGDLNNALSANSINFGDVLGSWFGDTTKDQKIYNQQLIKQAMMNKYYNNNMYQWQKEGLLKAGINPLIYMANHLPQINNSSPSYSDTSFKAFSNISKVLSILPFLLMML